MNTTKPIKIGRHDPDGARAQHALTEGFFAVAARQKRRPQTVAIVAADADFSRNPIAGARSNADKHGLRIISETRYPLATKDFAPLLREAIKDVEGVVFELVEPRRMPW